MTTRKPREEMTADELREALIIDCNKVLELMKETVEQGLGTAPEHLLKQGDAFIILAGALNALEYRYLELVAAGKVGNDVALPETTKKFYN